MIEQCGFCDSKNTTDEMDWKSIGNNWKSMDGNYEDIPMKKQQLGIMIGMMRITMDETR